MRMSAGILKQLFEMTVTDGLLKQVVELLFCPLEKGLASNFCTSFELSR